MFSMNGQPKPRIGTNEEILALAKEQQALQGEEAEQRRAVAIRAFEIVSMQLDRDANRMEEDVKSGKCTAKEMYEIVELSKGLRIAQSWIDGLWKSAQQQANGGN